MFKKLLFLLVLFLAFTGKVFAFKPETFVTFANPVRGPEGWQNPKQTPLELPRYQYQESTSSAYPMTWMLRYDAVTDATISGYFSNLIEVDKKQTLGAFLEITPSLTTKAGVAYPDGFSIFNANRIFLSGYSISDRQKLIDTFMQAFFGRFGFYPGSVAAWQLDSYSLEYLQSKYSVLTAMNCDDQYSMDHYRLWGGYLGSAYFPDKNNSLVPASLFSQRVNLAMVRWAQRDLFNFYGSKDASLYSVQVNDYLAVGQNSKYFESLLKLYEQKDFNEFTYLNIGLENDYNLALYKKEIKNVYKVIQDNRDKYNLRPISLAGFGDWFKARYPESSPAYFYVAKDERILPSNIARSPEIVYWYQSPFYRIGIRSNGGRSEIFDFRVYNRNIYEDYFATPNQDSNLSQEIPAIIDTVKYPGSELVFNQPIDTWEVVHSKQWDNWQVSLKDGDKELVLEPNAVRFVGFSAPALNSKDIKFTKTKNIDSWEVSPFTPYQKTTRLSLLFWIIIFIVLIVLFLKIKKNGKPKFLPLVITGIALSALAGFTVFRSGLLYPFGMGFWGPNGHDALFHLSLIESFAAHPLNFSHPQIAGEKIANYHFVFDFLSGLTEKFLGISSLDFYFRVFPILGGILIIYLLNTLLDSWNFTRKQKFLSFIFVFLAGSFGFIPKLLTGQDFFTGESAFWANQSVSIFLNPPYALSLIVLLYFLVILVKNNDLSSGKSILFLSLLGGLLAQTKVYAFILLLGALFFSKKFKLFFGVLIMGVLISLPFTRLGGGTPFIFSPLWFPRSLFASFDRFYYPRLVNAWQTYEASGNFVKLFLINLFALSVFYLGNLGIRFLGLFDMFKSEKQNLTSRIIFLITIFGLIIPSLFVQNINPWNTIQFMYYSLFFLGIYTARQISKLNIFILAPVICLAILTSVGTLKDYYGYFSSSRISYTELEALDTLKNEPHGIVLSPLYDQKTSGNIYAPKPLYSYVSTSYISALTGQPEFLSDTINLDITGFDYREKSRDLQRFYNTTDKAWAIDFLTKNNIKYVYETPLQKIKLAPADLHLKKIFDSGEINIYKII